MNPSEHIRSTTTQNDRKLKAVCEPLKKLGIDNFWYLTMSDCGYLSVIGSNAGIMEYFYDNKLYINHPGFRRPDLVPGGISMFNKDNDIHKMQEQIQKKFSVDHILQIHKKSHDHLYAYGFATTQNIPNMPTIYLNNLPLLKKFIHHFQNEASSIINRAKDNSVHLAPEMGEYFYHSFDNEREDKEKKHEFLMSINRLPKASKREREAISLLVRGYSARQIGEELGLSKRTVQHYLENIKNKWECYSKQELIEKGLQEIYGG